MSELAGPSSPLPPTVVEDLFRSCGADRWALTRNEFGEVLERSVRRAFPDGATARTLKSHLAALHLDDLALATACALGRDAAWDHFVLTHRPVLYRAADALSPGGGARELADSLYADLYGLRGPGGDRRSLFRYFHGRSSLATWLRAVLAQRHVDALRARHRTEPLEDDERAAPSVVASTSDPDRHALVPMVEDAMRAAIARLPAKDRLRLRGYYVSRLTLAAIGRITGEHEATVSRQLARTRRGLREKMERHLREEANLTDAQVLRALELAIEDPGGLDLEQMLAPRKESSPDRSR